MAGFNFDELEALDPSMEPELQVNTEAAKFDCLLQEEGSRSNLEVHVLTLGRGVAAKLRVSNGIDVKRLKAQIEEVVDIGVFEQRLVVGSRIITDDCLLKDLAVGRMPTAVTVVRVKVSTRVAISGSRDAHVIVWDLDTGEKLRELEGHTAALTCISANWQSRRAIGGSEDCHLYMWDLESGQTLWESKGHSAAVTSLAADWAGQRVVTGSLDTTLVLWNLRAGKVAHTLRGHTRAVLCVALSAAQSLALSAGEDLVLRVWDLNSGELQQELLGHQTPVYCVDFDVSYNLAVSGSFGILRIWDLDKGIWGWGATIESWRDLKGHTSAVTCLTVCWEGCLVLSGSADNSMRLWSLKPCSDSPESQRIRVFNGHTSPVTCLAVDWSSGMAISGSRDCTLRLWNVTRGVATRKLEGHTDWVQCVAICQEA